MRRIDLSNSFHPVPKPKDKKTRQNQKNVQIKKKSKKLVKKERDRYSILQEDDTKCFLCGRQIKLDKHEAFGGSNRQKSMEWGLVYYLCRKCHSKADTDETIKKYLHDYAKRIFIKIYTKSKFLKEFGKNFL